MTLLVAPVDAKAATYAVMNWHYSRRMPVGKLIRFGVWEDEKFIGVVLFGRGASPALGQPFGLEQTECCELVRIALTTHVTPVTQIVAITLRELKRTNPGLRLVISFADPNQNHRGGIYQAGNWIYNGMTSPMEEILFQGEWRHNRLFNVTGWGTKPAMSRLTDEEKRTLPRRKAAGKFRYLYPLDKAMRRQVERLRLPYPTAVEVSLVRRADSIDEG